MVVCSPSTRFSSSLLLLFSLGLSSFLLHACIHSFLVPSLLPLFLAFTAQWVRVYSSGLSRAARALFYEPNILTTYQPRARTHGHLFEKEPPTPVPGTDAEEEEKRKKKSAFNHARDAHYAGEYELILKSMKEREAQEKEEKANGGKKKEEKDDKNDGNSMRVELPPFYTDEDE